MGRGMRQLEVENQLREVVSRIIVQVELATAQGRTDINLALEDAFIPILKSVYNLPHLTNLNRKQKNYRQSNWHDDLLSNQKRLEHNLTVRNMVRFVAYFLSGASKGEDEDYGLRFLSLVEFNVRETD